jgi:hypothetical protein
VVKLRNAGADGSATVTTQPCRSRCRCRLLSLLSSIRPVTDQVEALGRLVVDERNDFRYWSSLSGRRQILAFAALAVVDTTDEDPRGHPDVDVLDGADEVSPGCGRRCS